MARDDTEEKLESAALTLLRHEGILAGLNLRAAADAAGVNRGIVYHYFGSRRQLLQSALRRRLSVNLRTVSRQLHTKLTERVLWMGQYLIRQREAVEITALLVLDGDDEILVMQFRDEVLEAHLALQESGEIADDVDVMVLHVYLTALFRGYVLHRKHLAKESGRKLRELDQQFLDMTLRTMTALQTPASGSSVDSDLHTADSDTE